MQTLYIFSGSDSYVATTPVADGANLPAEHGPWSQIKAVSSSDPRLEQGMGKDTFKDLKARGYSLRRVVVTFEPFTTMPTAP